MYTLERLAYEIRRDLKWGIPWAIRKTLVGIGCIALLINFTVRDMFPLFDTLYYTCPPPFYIIFFLPEYISKIKRKQWRPLLLFSLCFIALILASYPTLLSSRTPLPETPSPENIRIFYWTADNFADTSIEEAYTFAKEYNPDIIALVQGRVTHSQQTEVAKRILPEYSQELLQSGFAILYRKDITTFKQSFGTVGKGKGTYAYIELNKTDKKLYCVLYEQDKDFSYSRRVSLYELADRFEKESRKELVIMGNLNTPPDSYHFKAFRNKLSPAFEKYGQGFEQTWPAGFPLFTFDQIWTTPSVHVINYQNARPPNAQHKAIIMDIQWASSK